MRIFVACCDVVTVRMDFAISGLVRDKTSELMCSLRFTA